MHILVGSKGKYDVFVQIYLQTNSFSFELLIVRNDKLGFEVVFVSFSTQLNMKFQLHIKSKMLKKECFTVTFFLLINVKMRTIVGILTFMRRANFMFS